MADENETERTARGRAGSRPNAPEIAGASEGQVLSDLKSVGIDTDRMTEAAGQHVSELQRLVLDEVRARPMRALAWAAAAGVAFGFWAAK